MAMFYLGTGSRITSLKTGCRATQALFNREGDQLILVGTQGQPSKLKDGKFPNFGRVDIYALN